MENNNKSQNGKIKNRYNEYLKGATIGVVAYFVIFILIIFTNNLSQLLKVFVPIDNLTYIDSTSSILMAAGTIVYVAFTYYIFDATNKNTEQTATYQRISLIERRLELFYLPLENALKKINTKEVEKTHHFDKYTSDESDIILYSINRMSCAFIGNYNKLIQYTYLASNDVKTNIDSFASILNSNPLLNDRIDDAIIHVNCNIEYLESNKFQDFIMNGYSYMFIKNVETFIDCYKAIELNVNRDINLLKDELSNLVNL